MVILTLIKFILQGSLTNKINSCKSTINLDIAISLVVGGTTHLKSKDKNSKISLGISILGGFFNH